MNEYRFYHCYQEPVSIGCYPVDNEHVLPSKPNSRLLFVPNYVPERLDALVLNYKYHKSVHIKKAPVSYTGSSEASGVASTAAEGPA
jgi:hypothetical protein